MYNLYVLLCIQFCDQNSLCNNYVVLPLPLFTISFHYVVVMYCYVFNSEIDLNIHCNI